LIIRGFDPARDQEALRAGCVTLQDYERAIDPRMPPGEEIADAYLELMLARCREFDGAVLVAEQEGAVVGFVTIWSRYRSTEPDDDPSEYGFISDLVVSAKHRGDGIGRALLRAAEDRARQAGARALRLSVKAGNEIARTLYAAEGFEPFEVYLEKELTREPESGS
jgi:ribosomal protein S18 acetylase RimI-like enzyme